MARSNVAKAKLAALEEMGEDDLFEQIASGVSVRSLMKKHDFGYKLWSRWLDAKAGRRDRYAAAQMEAGHFFAERAIDTAQNTDPSMVNVARLQVDTDKWYASKLNAQYDTRQRDVAINISVNDLHAQAAQLLGDVIEGDAVEVGSDDE